MAGSDAFPYGCLSGRNRPLALWARASHKANRDIPEPMSVRTNLFLSDGQARVVIFPIWFEGEPDSIVRPGFCGCG